MAVVNKSVTAIFRNEAWSTNHEGDSLPRAGRLGQGITTSWRISNARPSRPRMPTPPTLRISAKNLGGMALTGFCPRCFWLGLHYDLPFGGSFPGIFSSLDSFSKKVVHAHFDRYKKAPSWLSPLGEFASYIPPPNSRTFYVDNLAAGVRLTGAPDDILVKGDGTKTIIDYKTAKHTHVQDALFPVYDVQLNGYALIANRVGLGPVEDIALVYTEPVTEGDADFFDGARSAYGFRMAFQAKVVHVDLDLSMIPPLLRKARRIFNTKKPPSAASGCEDCANFDTLATTVADVEEGAMKGTVTSNAGLRAKHDAGVGIVYCSVAALEHGSRHVVALSWFHLIYHR